MITKATFQWTVEVCIDVPEKESTINATAMLLHSAFKQLPDANPVVVKCIERPDVVSFAAEAKPTQ